MKKPCTLSLGEKLRQLLKVIGGIVLCSGAVFENRIQIPAHPSLTRWPWAWVSSQGLSSPICKMQVML